MNKTVPTDAEDITTINTHRIKKNHENPRYTKPDESQIQKIILKKPKSNNF